MDIVAVTTLLSSFLPALLKLGDKAAESIGSAVGKDGWETAKKIWEKLRPKVEENQLVQKAAESFAASPDDEDYKDLFQKKLQKLFKDNPDLVDAIAVILQESDSLSANVQINQTVTNNEGQVIGQMTDSKVIGSIAGDIQGGVNF